MRLNGQKTMGLPGIVITDPIWGIEFFCRWLNNPPKLRGGSMKVAFFGIHDYYMDDRPQIKSMKYPEETFFQVVELSDHVEEFLIHAMNLVSTAQISKKEELRGTCRDIFIDTDIICWWSSRIIKCFSGSKKPPMKHRLRRSALDFGEETRDINDKYIEVSREHDYDPILVSIDEYFTKELQERVVMRLSSALKISIRRAQEYYQSLRGTMITNVRYLNSINRLHWEIERSEMHDVAATLKKCVSIANELVSLSNHLLKIDNYGDFRFIN